MTGNVTKLLPDKGYGFIRGQDGKEHFFHRSAFYGHWDDLAHDFHQSPNIPVQFEEDNNNPKGPRASNVRRTDYPNQG